MTYKERVYQQPRKSRNSKRIIAEKNGSCKAFQDAVDKNRMFNGMKPMYVKE